VGQTPLARAEETVANGRARICGLPQDSSRTRLAIVLLTSNVAAALLTYFLTYERPTSIGYSLSTSTLSTNALATSVPGLEMRIGSESLSEIHFHTVSLRVSGKYLPEVPIALEFQKRS
jgi:hypothetical protein